MMVIQTSLAPKGSEVQSRFDRFSDYPSVMFCYVILVCYVMHAFVLRHVVCVVSSYCVVQLYGYSWVC